MQEKNSFQESAVWLEKFHRLTNYIGAAQLYLRQNYFLENELSNEDIKDRILGHWGTVPGLNLMFGGINLMIKQYDLNSIFVVGSGHGAPATLANLVVEGSLGKYYSEYLPNKEGIGRLIHDFSWPNKFPSHNGPMYPGNIHEGGELGYSLGTAVGAVLDNPDLIAFCQVGDGEAETGPLAASWQSNKFINPITDGAVLPILHINGYKIANPTLYSLMSDEELAKYFEGLGWKPIFVSQYDSGERIYEDFLESLDQGLKDIWNIQKSWRELNKTDKPIWPLIVLRSKKGWTGPKSLKDKQYEDYHLSHGIPLQKSKSNDEEFDTLKKWLESYRVEDFFDENGELIEEITSKLPADFQKLGQNSYAFGPQHRTSLLLPKLNELEDKLDKGEACNSMIKTGEYLRDLYSLNKNNFRLFSPDETSSNKLDKVFEATCKTMIWPIRDVDQNIECDGRIMEILSEHVLMEWMTGYNMTGRHGVLVSYEAFLSIIVSQIDQYIKFLKKSESIPWRQGLPSLNLISTSTAWIQEHNGFSHQNPSLISTLLSTQSDFVSVYFPADSNIMLATLDDSFSRKDSLNLITASKRDTPCWLSIAEAKEHVRKGISIWKFACTYDGVDPDVVIASVGDTQTEETLAGIAMLKEIAPTLHIRYININELTCLGLGDERIVIDSEVELDELFTKDKPVLVNYHGYPQNIHQLFYGKDISLRSKALGYIEQGTTTTSFDMQVANKTSRYHVVLEALLMASRTNQDVAKNLSQNIQMIEEKLRLHTQYIQETGDDLEEIKNWKWK